MSQPSEEQPTEEPFKILPLKERPLIDRWRNYLRNIPSPDSFIDFGFYYMIGACLQRRVWTGALQEPLFANPYTILVGKPGVGKGRVIKVVNQVLRFHELPPPDATPSKNAKELSLLEIYQKAILKQHKVNLVENKEGKEKEKPLIFPVAADATTYEALVQAIAGSTRRIKFMDTDGKLSPYTHNSICFVLEELSSLFKKHSEDVGKFLLNAYDCGDYTYATKTKGTDRIRKCCVSLLAGTTPDFIEESYSARTMEQGLSSRMWFIFEFCNRRRVFGTSELDDSQKEDYAYILAHIEKLSQLYGHAPLSPEAFDYMKNWWVNEELKNRVNNNAKLEHYYARKDVHVQKLAMALHYSDSLVMEIPLSACLKAIDILAKVEKNMHMALSYGNDNPLAKIGDKVVKLMSKTKETYTFAQLHLEFWGSCKKTEFEEIINTLLAFGKIEATTENRGEVSYRIATQENTTEEITT